MTTIETLFGPEEIPTKQRSIRFEVVAFFETRV